MERIDTRLIRIATIASACLLAPMVVALLPPDWGAALVLGGLPAILALILAGVSLRVLARNVRGIQLGLSVLVLFLLAASLSTLKGMFIDGGWPTYLPYYATAIAGALVVAQSRLARWSECA